MMRVLIVDDEAPARDKLRRLLGREADVEIVAEAGDGEAAVRALREHAPDVVFLDIQMPRLDGFGVVRELGVAAMPFTVFVTAFDQHALDAFEVRALDYLLKPFGAKRFGEIHLHLFNKAMDDHPEITELLKTPEMRYNAGGRWHSDQMYTPKPAKILSLPSPPQITSPPPKPNTVSFPPRA